MQLSTRLEEILKAKYNGSYRKAGQPDLAYLHKKGLIDGRDNLTGKGLDYVEKNGLDQ